MGNEKAGQRERGGKPLLGDTVPTRSAPHQVAPLFPLLVGTVVFVVFYVWPLCHLIGTSLRWTDLSLEGYRKMLEEPVYLKIIGNTLKISMLVTACCLLVGFPYALFLSRLRGRARGAMMAIAMLPIFVNPLAIICAWTIILQRHGLVNESLHGLGLISSPLPLCYNLFSVCLVMTYLLFPLVVLPCFANLSRLDRRLVAAARNLGANRMQVFVHVELPVCVRALVTGALIVFALSLGYFVTPALLGGRRETMISMIIAERFNVLFDWQFGAALSVVLVLVIGALLLLGSAVVQVWKRHESIG